MYYPPLSPIAITPTLDLIEQLAPRGILLESPKPLPRRKIVQILQFWLHRYINMNRVWLKPVEDILK